MHKKIYQNKILTAVLLFLLLWIFINIFLYEPDIPVEELKTKYTTSTSKFIDVDGLSIHYRIEGEGKPLVLIHGTGSMLQTWDDWTTLLKPYYQIIRMDIPAFGLTGPRADGNYSDSMYIDFIEKFTQKINTDSFYLAGNSLGGLIAWKYAAAYPEKVKKMVLIDPAGFYKITNQKSGSFIFKMARNYPTIMKLFSKIGTHFFIEKTLREAYYDDSKITMQKKKMYAELNQRFGNRHAFTERARFVKECSEEELKSVSALTLVLWGKEDVLIDVKEAEHFKAIPNSSFIFYDKVGHCPQEEIPEQSAKDVFRFLQN